MKKTNNFFTKFIYLAAVQLILVSQLLVIAVAITANPIYAESGSGSDGQTVIEESNSGSSSSEETNSGSGTSGGDTTPTDESAGASEQTADTTDPNAADGSNSGSGSSSSNDENITTEEPTTDVSDPNLADGSNSGSGSQEEQTSNSGSGNTDSQVQENEEPVAGEEPIAGEEPVISLPVISNEEQAGGTQDAPGDTIHVAPEGTAPEGTPTTILDQVTVPAAGEIDPATGFPAAYQDATGIAVVPCLDGTDPNCVLPGAGEEPNFDPSQPTVLDSNFPSEFFYWIAESDLLETPNGGKTFIRTAVEGAFLNEEPVDGDQMVFGRIRVTGTGLEPNSEYTVTHPYGVDTYTTDEGGIIKRGEGTQDIGCFGAPCNFAEALGSPVFENFLRWDSGAPAGYLGDAATPHTVVGSPTGQNFFRIEGPGLPLEGLFTNLFAVAGKLLSGEFLPGVPQAGGEAPAEVAPGASEAGTVDETTGFPASYQDALGTSVVSCLDGTDPNCVLPAAGEEAGFDPTQPTELGTNFPSEFFYWIAESDLLETPNGGKTFFRMAVEGAFLNEEPLAGDQMVFGRLRLTGTGLEPNSVYTVTHPYGVDTYVTDELGIVRRGEGTEDIGCFGAPCNFAAALQSRVFEGFLRWDSGAPAGYLGDAVTPHTVTGSPTGNNFFRIEGPGLGEGGLFTNLFTVAGKLASTIGSTISGIVDTVLPGVEPIIDTDLPSDIVADAPDTEVIPVPDPVAETPTTEAAENEVTESVEQEAGVELTATEALASAQPTVDATADNSDSNDTSQQSSNQAQTAASGSSDNNSGSGSSDSNSGTSGSSEVEQRGSETEGEVANNALVLGAEALAVTEEESSEEVADGEQSQQANTNPWETFPALVVMASAVGFLFWKTIAGLGLNPKGLRFR
ncbi:hypothetical protein HYU45_03820 [Candidatus Daviesbacteria bacterium]|nr:hypothetical protein [Candidatus Daviesbacteria bacterium]